jgi:hypothetical protein
MIEFLWLNAQQNLNEQKFNAGDSQLPTAAYANTTAAKLRAPLSIQISNTETGQSLSLICPNL